jgi:hypothetical protein
MGVASVPAPKAPKQSVILIVCSMGGKGEESEEMITTGTN